MENSMPEDVFTFFAVRVGEERAKEIVERGFLTVPEVAQMAGVDKSTAYRWAYRVAQPPTTYFTLEEAIKALTWPKRRFSGGPGSRKRRRKE